MRNRRGRLAPKAEGHDLVVVGASAGGISAITALLAGLPADLPAAVLIVLHLAPDSGTMLPGIFGANSSLPVDLAEDGAPLSPFTCPSCHGSLWEMHDDHVLRFRCHTGHAFSAESLDAEHGDEYENALFGALRALEENAGLARRIATRSRDERRDHVAKMYEDKAAENDRSAKAIRRMLARAGRPIE